jgi:glycosyltransferase involved in cell wall biosynthesis
LRRGIERTLGEGLPPIVSTLRPAGIKDDWVSVHDSVATIPAKSTSSESIKHLVSVCVTHYERPRLLRRALDALLDQTYDAIEIVIVDDGSRSSAAKAALREIECMSYRFPVSVIRSENRYLGAARNLAARHAKGEFLLFHDDDNVAEPHQVATFVSAAMTSKADILTSLAFVLDEGDEANPSKSRILSYYPLGIGGLFSFFQNRFGDANALIRRTVFKAVGDFTELYGVGLEDWEFFLKAFLKGYRMGVVPEPLFHYRVSSTGMLATGNIIQNIERIYALIDDFRPALGSDLFRYIQRETFLRQNSERLKVRVAQERGAVLHLQIIELDPNSVEARVKLSDLAVELGRFSDAIDLGAEVYEQREKLAALLAHSRLKVAKPRR